MIDVIQKEKLEFTVGHTLKIDQIDLTPNTESICDNIFMPATGFFAFITEMQLGQQSVNNLHRLRGMLS